MDYIQQYMDKDLMKMIADCSNATSLTRSVSDVADVTGTVMKHWVAAAVQKLPNDKDMKKDGKGTSAQVTTEDGKNCVVKCYDNKPVLMMRDIQKTPARDGAKN